MFTSLKKIKKLNKDAPTPFEETVAQHLMEIQNSSSQDWKVGLKKLFIKAAKEVEVNNKQVTLIFVPKRLLKEFHQIQLQLTAELEKKLSGKQVIFVAQRTITPRNRRFHHKGQTRFIPYSQTPTAVFEAVLNDILYPVEITDKRIRYKSDGSVVHKIILNPKDKQAVEGRTEAYEGIYKRLTGRTVVFEFSTHPKIES